MSKQSCTMWFSRLTSLLMAFVISGVLAFGQTKTVTGTVVDDLGEPVLGANVIVKGTTNGATTDLDGKYSIQNVANNATLQVSFIGYTTQEIPVDGKSVIDITLREDSEMLDDVVVIGYQTVRRKDLTGSVASINNKALAAAPVSNVAQALQGKMPGVNVVSQDGRPDASISIRVRGGGSITQSNEPLILIDGVEGKLSDIPSDNIESIDVLKDASSTAIYGSRGANGVIIVTTKSAKEGKTNVSYSGYAKWNTPVAYIDAMNPYDYLSYVWANSAANGTAYIDSFTKLFGIGSYGDIERYRNVDHWDVQKDVYNSSFSHNHDLTVSGGSEKTKALLSFSYSDEQGMKVNSGNQRATVSLKVNHKLNKAVDTAMDVRYTQTNTLGKEDVSTGSGSILSFAYRFRPISMADIEAYGDPSALHQGNVEQYGKSSLWETNNPYARLMDYEPRYNRQVLNANASLNWKIINGLTYHTELTGRRTWNQNQIWSGAVYNDYLNNTTGEPQWSGAAQLYKADVWNIRWTNTLNYNVDFNKNNHLTVLVGHEVTDSEGTSMTMKGDHFPVNFERDNAFSMINRYDKNNSTEQNPYYAGWTQAERIISFFGRVNYSLFDRYLFTFTMRADGSSRFAPSNHWGYFPAAAVAWRLSDEPWMESTQDWLSNAKVRFSYGSVGNDGINSSLWSQDWKNSTASTAYAINGVSQDAYDLSSSTMANPDLKWETTITRNLGFDFGFWNGRLNGTVDLYWNTTKDLLMNTELPTITGFKSTYDNIGQTSNRGIELSLNGTIFQNKDWTVSAGFNINFNKNKVDELAEGVSGIYGTGWFSSGNPGNDFCLIEGEAVGLVRGLKYVGMYTTDDFDYNPQTHVYTLKKGVPDVSPNITGVMHGLEQGCVPSGQNAYPGMAKYADVDGNGMVDSADYDVIGNMNATHTGGFNLNVAYKNWDLAAYFNWSYGNEVYNINRMASVMGYKESGVYQNHMAFMNQCYKIYAIEGGQLVRKYSPEDLNKLNANSKYPLCYNESGVVSDLGIEDGSYLRLGTLTLGYTLPKTALNKLHIQNLRVYGTIYNLFTLTDYSGLDPEVSTDENVNGAVYPTPGLDWGAYPRARSFVLGLNINF